MSLRLIIDMSSSPYHPVARWLAETLEPVRKLLAKHSLRDTFEFVDLIIQVNISGLTMASSDVVSLFIDVPLTDTVCYLCNFIDSNNLNIGVRTKHTKELILRCTLSVQFLFNVQIY